MKQLTASERARLNAIVIKGKKRIVLRDWLLVSTDWRGWSAVGNIRDWCIQEFGIDKETFLSEAKTREVQLARWAFYFLATKMAKPGISRLGKAANKHHTTVHHALVSQAEFVNGPMKGVPPSVKKMIKHG